MGVKQRGQTWPGPHITSPESLELGSSIPRYDADAHGRDAGFLCTVKESMYCLSTAQPCPSSYVKHHPASTQACPVFGPSSLGDRRSPSAFARTLPEVRFRLIARIPTDPHQRRLTTSPSWPNLQYDAMGHALLLGAGPHRS
jgi:hypothetical protein